MNIKAETIRRLKMMNNSYPENSVDFDSEFVYYLAVSVFKILEIEGFVTENNLKCFDVERLRFVKGELMI